MIKRLALATTILIGTLSAAAPAAASGALLRNHVLVDGPMVTLGDLFDNAGERANVQVLRAPPPGQHITVDTDWLSHVALVNGLSWKPRDLFDEASIERVGQVIGRDQIVANLHDALVTRGARGDFSVELESRSQQMVVATDAAANVTVRVTNTHSNLTVEGVIDGTNRVRVSLSGPVAMAN